MPIVELQGDLLKSECDILVNTVNCFGVMGKGIALEFKTKYPAMFKKYKSDCEKKLYVPGSIKEYVLPDCRIILNFSTKNHWRDPSDYNWIESGLKELYEYLKGTTYTVAIPALGCSNGQLEWSIVSKLIHDALGDLENHIELYIPRS